METLNILTSHTLIPYDSMLRPINAVLNAYGNGTLTNQSASQNCLQCFNLRHLT